MHPISLKSPSDTMNRIRLQSCLVVLISLNLNVVVEAQNQNWVPARQFRAIDQWQREKRGGPTTDPETESTKPADGPVASGGPKKTKTKTSNVSADSGPILLPPTPSQIEVPENSKIQPESLPAKTKTSTRKVVPAEIPEGFEPEPAFKRGVSPQKGMIQTRSPESVTKDLPSDMFPIRKKEGDLSPPQTTPSSPKSSPAELRPDIKPEVLQEIPSATRSPAIKQKPPEKELQSRAPVTILKPIPESANSPVRSRQTNRYSGSYRAQTNPTDPSSNQTRTVPVQPEVPQGSQASAPSSDISETGGDHWIVSARRCDETELVKGCRDCLDFFHGTGQTPLRQATWDEFFGSLQPTVPLSFFIHGSFINWRWAVIEAHETARWIRSASPNSPVRVVYFTWPSDVNLPHLLPIDVNVLGQRSSNYGFHLAHLIGELPREQPVTLVGHSHGARLASATMHLLGGGSIDGDQLPVEMTGQRKIRLVLASAALDRNWLNPGQLYGQALALPEAVLNLKNSTDYALNAYPLSKPFGVDSLGQTGPKLQDRMQLGNWNSKFMDLELAPILGTAHTWPHYYSQPELARTIAPYVFHEPLLAQNLRSSGRPLVKAMPMPNENDRMTRKQQKLKPQSISGVKSPKAIPVDVTPVRSGTR